MHRKLSIVGLILTGLLVALPEAPASAGHAHHPYDRVYVEAGHRHGPACPPHRVAPRHHARQPFFEPGHHTYGYRPRYTPRPYVRGHGHRHRPVAFLRPGYRHGWRYCEIHGGWFRIADFVLVY